MLYYKEESFELHHGKMQDVLQEFEDNSIDSIVCDPPYELNFMGKGWDNSGVAFQKETWQHCYRVLKAGGYLLAFGGTRTFHRIACAIEDAGFEIRDTIMWLYGSGFPKSMNIGLAIDKKNGVESKDTGIISPNARPNCDKTNTLYESGTVGKTFTIKQAQNEWAGWGTALKPAFEPIIVARKPIENTIVDNVLKYRVGGLNIDECRVKTNDDLARINKNDNGMFGVGNNGGNTAQICKELGIEYGGRFPANVILTYDEIDKEEVCGGMPYCKSSLTPISDNRQNTKESILGITGIHDSSNSYEDEGSAARYFYCAKASKKDRDSGMMDFENQKKVFNGKSNNSSKEIKDVEKRFTTVAKNIHPTVKPIELMQYLVRLVSPKGSRVLDCFMGSGSTGKATMFENRERNAGYYFIGIEMTEEYLPIAKARIEYGKYKYEYDNKQEQLESMQEYGYMQQSIFD